MSRIPAISANGRKRRIACVAGLALGQAAAAGLAAFATRDAFAALHDGAGAPMAALAAIAVSGCAIAALRVAERAVAERLGGAYVADAREKLFLRLARTPPRALARRRRGGVALRFVGDMAAIRGWVAQGTAAADLRGDRDPGDGDRDSQFSTLGSRWRRRRRCWLALAALAALGRPLAEAHRQERRRRGRLGDRDDRTHGARGRPAACRPCRAPSAAGCGRSR
jgi:hypothetical protein